MYIFNAGIWFSRELINIQSNYKLPSVSMGEFRNAHYVTIKQI